MNIYALNGFKVTVTKESADNGTSQDIEKVKKYLKVGEIYTVAVTKVSKNHSRVCLQELLGVVFNTINFEDVEKQTPEKDQQHSDWARYNRR